MKPTVTRRVNKAFVVKVKSQGMCMVRRVKAVRHGPVNDRICESPATRTAHAARRVRGRRMYMPISSDLTRNMRLSRTD